MTNQRLNQIKERYSDAARSYGECILEGQDSDQYFDAVEKAFVELKAYGKDGLDRIADLLRAEDEGVRLWASAHLLNYPEYHSLPVLEEVSKSQTMLALTAMLTIEQWRNGKIKY